MECCYYFNITDKGTFPNKGSVLESYSQDLKEP